MGYARSCRTGCCLILQQVLNLDPTLVELLVQKGIRTFEEARDYFRPKLEDLHDPF